MDSAVPALSASQHPTTIEQQLMHATMLIRVHQALAHLLPRARVPQPDHLVAAPARDHAARRVERNCVDAGLILGWDAGLWVLYAGCLGRGGCRAGSNHRGGGAQLDELERLSGQRGKFVKV